MQKNLNKNKKKVVGRNGGGKKKNASVHGVGKVTRKGRMEKAPKKAGLRKAMAEEKKITKIINGQNEGTFAGVAQNAGGKLSVLKAPLPVDSRSKNVRKGKNGGVPWGASSK